jgi:hypothetical protein
MDQVAKLPMLESFVNEYVDISSHIWQEHTNMPGNQ